MQETDRRTHGESSGESTTNEDTDVRGPAACHETVDPATREAVLTEYEYRCQLCGRRGPEKGGLAALQAHHIEREPTGMGEHDLANLTLICRSCHSWHHQQSTPADAPVNITEEDLTVLLPQDIEILQVLADSGPARTGDVAAALTGELSVSAVRERLWVLMGLDNIVESRDRQVVDKDIETGEWGLTDQVENSARGYIPDDPQLLLQRMEDEQVRLALNRGCDRRTVADVLGVTRRTTFNKEKRANAYAFPLDAFSRGGRPVTGTRSETTGSVEVGESDRQQRLDRVSEPVTDGAGNKDASIDSESQAEQLGGEEGVVAVSGDGEGGELPALLRDVIDALERAESAL
ncbi:HNH endonuclease [Halovivax gelatinilyticus]|uniref:HNH endonuclease n=1 Tax=Halovivax gelatinilyticus TaxID=2961597 RepID=UPI0020CA9172|nr:HNH endonuclease signature motif containing protein [Halovivax gelatinilyticus]